VDERFATLVEAPCDGAPKPDALEHEQRLELLGRRLAAALGLELEPQPVIAADRQVEDVIGPAAPHALAVENRGLDRVAETAVRHVREVRPDARAGRQHGAVREHDVARRAIEIDPLDELRARLLLGPLHLRLTAALAAEVPLELSAHDVADALELRRIRDTYAHRAASDQ